MRKKVLALAVLMLAGCGRDAGDSCRSAMQLLSDQVSNALAVADALRGQIMQLERMVALSSTAAILLACLAAILVIMLARECRLRKILSECFNRILGRKDYE